MAKRRKTQIVKETDAVEALHRVRPFARALYGGFVRYGTWADILKRRRDMRLYFTGQFRAPSLIQTLGMVFLGGTGIVLFAILLYFALQPSFQQTSPTTVVIFIYSILGSGLLGISSFVNGIASLIGRSWRFDLDNYPDKADDDELNVYAALFMGEWRTRKPLFIFAQLAVGFAFIAPLLLTFSEITRNIPPSIISEEASSTDLFTLMLLLVIPLFLIGGLLLMNASLNIWRMAREDEKERDRE